MIGELLKATAGLAAAVADSGLVLLRDTLCGVSQHQAAAGADGTTVCVRCHKQAEMRGNRVHWKAP